MPVAGGDATRLTDGAAYDFQARFSPDGTEVLFTSDRGGIFSVWIAVDVIVANVWMAFLLYGVGRSAKIDKFMRADSSAIEDLKQRVEAIRAQIMKIPSLTDTMKLLGIGFGVMGIGHFCADIIAPWLKPISARWLSSSLSRSSSASMKPLIISAARV